MSDRARLAAAFLARHADSGARALESLPAATAAAVLELTEPTVAAAVLAQMLPTSAARCAEHLPLDAAVATLTALEVPDAAAIVRHLAPASRDAVMAALGAQWLVAFKLLLSYPPHTVGAWMDVTTLALPDDWDTAEASMRLHREGRQARQRVYVLDRDRRVRGAVPLLALVQSRGPRPLAALLEPADALWAREPLAGAQESGVWEHYAEAPVVNRDRQYVGAISYTDLRRAQRQLAAGPLANGEAAANPAAEVVELLAIGAGSVWQELTELVNGGQAPRR